MRPLRVHKIIIKSDTDRNRVAIVSGSWALR